MHRITYEVENLGGTPAYLALLPADPRRYTFQRATDEATRNEIDIPADTTTLVMACVTARQADKLSEATDAQSVWGYLEDGLDSPESREVDIAQASGLTVQDLMPTLAGLAAAAPTGVPVVVVPLHPETGAPIIPKRGLTSQSGDIRLTVLSSGTLLRITVSDTGDAKKQQHNRPPWSIAAALAAAAVAMTVLLGYLAYTVLRKNATPTSASASASVLAGGDIKRGAGVHGGWKLSGGQH